MPQNHIQQQPSIQHVLKILVVGTEEQTEQPTQHKSHSSHSCIYKLHPFLLFLEEGPVIGSQKILN